MVKNYSVDQYMDPLVMSMGGGGGGGGLVSSGVC